MLASWFKQQLLEALLECLMVGGREGEDKGYERFCDRLEREMLPYVVSNVGVEEGVEA